MSDFVKLVEINDNFKFKIDNMKRSTIVFCIRTARTIKSLTETIWALANLNTAKLSSVMT